MIKKIENFTGKAPKLSKIGYVQYCLFVDEKGAIYINLIDNLLDSKNRGTFPDILFKVSEYLENYNDEKWWEEMRGFDPKSFEQVVSRDNNTKGFVRAVLCQLFPHLKK